MRKLKNILYYNQNYLFIMTIIVLIFAILFAYFYPLKSKYQGTEKEFMGTIHDIKEDNENTTIVLLAKEKLILKRSTKDLNFNLGDYVKVSGTLVLPSQNKVPNLFNYQACLSYQKIFYLVDAKEITKIRNNTNLFYEIKNKIIKFLSRYSKINPYLKAFVLGDKNDLSDLTIKSYQTNGIMHLFSISGLHVSIIAGTILYFLKKISYNKLFNYFIVNSFLFGYLCLTGFTVSLLRSFLLYFLVALNDIWHLKIKKNNLVQLVLIIILLINPFYLYNLGFQLSYLVSFNLILFSNKINQYKYYLSKLLSVSFLSFLSSLPLIVNINFEINFLSILFNLLFVPFVCYLVLPSLFLTLIFPFLEGISSGLINYLEKCSCFLSSINILKLSMAKFNLSYFLVYYLFLYLSLFKKKHYLLLIIFMFFYSFKVYFNGSMSMIMLDVGEGDSIFIKYPNNRMNILVDTGGYYSYEVTENITIPYLKSIGIRSLDYLIITHGDYDHMGSSNYLVNHFPIKKVIFNSYNFNNLELKLIKDLETKKIHYYHNIEALNIGENKLLFLNSKSYANENDDSNVIYFNYKNTSILLMGDASKTRENDLLEQYHLVDIDILKVGHHGSDSSTSIPFIKNINPKTCLISVGKNNRYGHPKDSVLDTLKECTIYRTDLNGSITISLKDNHYNIKTIIP